MAEDKEDRLPPLSQLASCVSPTVNVSSDNEYPLGNKRSPLCSPVESPALSHHLCDSSCSASSESDADCTNTPRRKRRTKKKRHSTKQENASDTNEESESDEKVIQVSGVGYETHDSDEEYMKNPSKEEHYIFVIDPSHTEYEVVSQGVQTDWSWLRDKAQNNAEDGKGGGGNTEVEAVDMEAVQEQLQFGLYGGFYTATGGEEVLLGVIFCESLSIAKSVSNLSIAKLRYSKKLTRHH